MRFVAIALLSLGLGATTTLAAERRQHDAHEHGHMAMHVVLEGDTLAIEIEAPGMDVVGFEHAPHSEEDKSRIVQALSKLEDAQMMFTLPKKALCTISHVHVEHGAIKSEKHEGHHSDAEDHHADKKDHHTGAEDHHADNKGHHSEVEGHHAEEESNHSAFHGRYEWRCAAPEALKRVQVRYFKSFPATDEIEASIIGPNSQTALELTADSAEIKF